MAPASPYQECFNTKLTEFLSDLVVCFPDAKDLKMFRSGLQLAINMNPTLPQKVFDEHMTEAYEKSILDRDDSFFLHEDYSHITETHNVDLDIINMLKGMWHTLDETNKNAVWKYMQVLVLLNRKCKAA